MKRLANLLIALGTILAGIGAASSARPWTWLALEDEHLGQFLFEDVFTEWGVLARAGDELDAQTVAALRGRARVKVSDPPRPTASIPLDEAAGRVLASEVALGERTATFPAGRRLTARILATLATAREPVTLELTDDRGAGVEAIRLDPAAPGAGAELVGRELAAAVAVAVPDVLPAGRFVDDEVAGRLRAAALERVTVTVDREFRWGRWPLRWLFVAGLLVMGAGVVLLRRTTRTGSGPSASHVPLAEAHRLVGELARELAALEGRDDLDAAALHRAVDALIADRCFPIVAARESIQRELGRSGFADFMSTFAGADRTLNRAWSAAVDGHAHEANECIRLARELCDEAGKHLEI